LQKKGQKIEFHPYFRVLCDYSFTIFPGELQNTGETRLNTGDPMPNSNLNFITFRQHEFYKLKIKFFEFHKLRARVDASHGVILLRIH
jgi:hypothetical protein